MKTITLEALQQNLARRINESEAELEALKRVTINTNHKALTNRSVENGRIGDYMGIGKALYISYQFEHRYLSFDMIAYSYEDEAGNELGSTGWRRNSRTLTPAELKSALDDVITKRRAALHDLKVDLVNAPKFVKRWNKLAEQHEALVDSVTWATREVIR